MKFLLVLLVVVVGLWLLLGRGLGQWRRQSRQARRSADARATAHEMVRCAHCGVHLPRVDARERAGHAYCCAEHESAGPRDS